MDDPRRELAEQMLKALGKDDVPILAYYASFERGVIQDLADLFPDLSNQLEAVIARVLDLHPVVKAHTYLPEYRGSFSLKAVAPALVSELEYDDLEGIAGGLEASAAFWRLATGEFAKGENTEELRDQLLAYCSLDTLALVKIQKVLRQLA